MAISVKQHLIDEIFSKLLTNPQSFFTFGFSGKTQLHLFLRLISKAAVYYNDSKYIPIDIGDFQFCRQSDFPDWSIPCFLASHCHRLITDSSILDNKDAVSNSLLANTSISKIALKFVTELDKLRQMLTLIQTQWPNVVKLEFRFPIFTLSEVRDKKPVVEVITQKFNVTRWNYKRSWLALITTLSTSSEISITKYCTKVISVTVEKDQCDEWHIMKVKSVIKVKSREDETRLNKVAAFVAPDEAREAIDSLQLYLNYKFHYSEAVLECTVSEAEYTKTLRRYNLASVKSGCRSFGTFEFNIQNEVKH